MKSTLFVCIAVRLFQYIFSIGNGRVFTGKWWVLLRNGTTSSFSTEMTNYREMPGRHLEKKVSGFKPLHARAESWNYLRVRLEMIVHSGVEQVTGKHAKDKKRERGALRLTVIWLGWALHVPQIWRVQPVFYGEQWKSRSTEQATVGRDVIQRLTGHIKEPEMRYLMGKMTHGPGKESKLAGQEAETLKVQES